MKVEDLINQLMPYKDFDLKVNVHLNVMEEELQERTYGFSHDDFEGELKLDDIGHSDKDVYIGVEIVK